VVMWSGLMSAAATSVQKNDYWSFFLRLCLVPEIFCEKQLCTIVALFVVIW
jgi:hypothetical protein